MIMTPVRAGAPTHDIAGQLVEICACPSVCPCWAVPATEVVGCGSVVVWYVDRGRVDGVDVSSRIVAASVHPPADPGGAKGAGGWRTEIIIDERCTPVQHAALLRVFTRALGCALADMVRDQPDHHLAHTRHRALHRAHRQPDDGAGRASGPASEGPEPVGRGAR
jgi:hypothetical protein